MAKKMSLKERLRVKCFTYNELDELGIHYSRMATPPYFRFEDKTNVYYFLALEDDTYVMAAWIRKGQPESSLDRRI